MSSYDVAICMDQGALDGVISAIFARGTLREKIFSGSESTTLAGARVEVFWEVLQAPTVTLEAPTPEQWKNAIRRDRSTAQPEINAFTIAFPRIRVGRIGSNGQRSETVIRADAICTATIANGAPTLTPLAATVDLDAASAMDRTIYTAIIVPQVLKMMGVLLAEERLPAPAIGFPRVAFGPVAVSLGAGRLVGVAALAGRPVPAPADPAELPEGPFYVLLSPDALAQLASAGTQQMIGKSMSTSGSRDFGFTGSAEYTAGIRLESATADIDPNDLTTINARVGITPTASAGINTMFGMLINVIGESMTTMANGVRDVMNTAADTAGDIVNTTIDNARDVAGTIGDGIVDVGGTIGEGIVDTGETIGGGIVDTGESIADGAEDVAGAIGDAFSSY